MPVCLIGIGSNLGDRQGMLERAVSPFRLAPDITVLKVSRWLETAPVGGPPGQQPFLNGAMTIETALSPLALLNRLHQIERDAGRERKLRWEARTLDVDLLLYGQERIDDVDCEGGELVVPHPRLAVRRFVLAPAAEIAAEMVDPVTGWTIARLLEHLETAPGYVAVSASVASVRPTLAQELAHDWTARCLTAPSFGPDFAALPPRQMLSELQQTLSVQSELLSAAGWPETVSARSAGAPPAVSDFWFDDLAVIARRWLPPYQLEPFLRDWRAARAQIVRPLFVVTIDHAEFPADAGPVLRCQSATDDGIKKEVRAAVTGMQPTPPTDVSLRTTAPTF